MKKIACLLGLMLVVATQCAWGQALVRMPFPRTQPVEPQPDKDGIYSQGMGLTPAQLVHGSAAVFPGDPSSAKVKHVCAFLVVVGIDGKPSAIELLNQHPSKFDDVAIAAVKESQFSPADYKGKPVPTRMTVWVPFIGGKNVLPALVTSRLKGVTPPVAGNSDTVGAEFPAQARQDKVDSGTVLVHVRVSEEGKVIDATVIRAAGHGFDENALKAAEKYRFKPATFEGAPVLTDITVQVNFTAF